MLIFLGSFFKVEVIKCMGGYAYVNVYSIGNSIHGFSSLKVCLCVCVWGSEVEPSKKKTHLH